MYAFVAGSEHQAVVEYAPSQKIPSQKSKPRVDARQGQIDKGMSVVPSWSFLCLILFRRSGLPLVSGEFGSAGSQA